MTRPIAPTRRNAPIAAHALHALKSHRVGLMTGMTLSALLALALLASPAHANDAHHAPTAKPATADANQAWVDAEVRKLDRDSGKVTLAHAAIAELEMPAMTMAFHAKDKSMLDSLKPGDKVQFKTVREGGRFVITALKPAP